MIKKEGRTISSGSGCQAGFKNLFRNLGSRYVDVGVPKERIEAGCSPDGSPLS